MHHLLVRRRRRPHRWHHLGRRQLIEQVEQVRELNTYMSTYMDTYISKRSRDGSIPVIPDRTTIGFMITFRLRSFVITAIT